MIIVAGHVHVVRASTLTESSGSSLDGIIMMILDSAGRADKLATVALL
jgi:hypothetical protein